MNVKAMKLAVKIAFLANKPVFMAGQPGVGKSRIIDQIADEMGFDKCEQLNALIIDAVDLSGIPVPVEYENEEGKKIKKTIFFPTDLLPQEGSGVLNIEELPAAPPALQAALYQLVLERRMGTYKMPDTWRIIACGNRLSDRGVVNHTPLPLINRLQWWNLDFDVDIWIEWALKNNIRLDVIAFAKFRPSLFEFRPETIDNEAFLSPRSMEALSNVLDFYDDLKQNTTDPEEIKLFEKQSFLSEIVAGNIGVGSGAEFIAFQKIIKKITPPDAILASPEFALIPDSSDPSLLYATVMGVSRRVSASTADNFFTYINRLDPEYSILAYKTALSLHGTDITDCRGYFEYVQKHEDILQVRI